MDEFMAFYAANLRASLFTGFMTLTGFLFTLHTFLLVTLHRDLYGQEDYQKSVIQIGRKTNPKLNPLGPLRIVSRVLFGMLCIAFVTSISQLTIGLIAKPWAVIGCVALALVAVVSFCGTLVMFGIVISDWLNYVERRAEREFGGNVPEPEDTARRIGWKTAIAVVVVLAAAGLGLWYFLH